ncbi:MAG: methionyl-tRNA formyltransferase [bacterium]|nr:methionyl-tRNA formyltransferase [bacterium]
MGSPAISARLLEALLESSHEVAFVVSNPDTPRGRSSRLQPTEVSALALERNLPLFRPQTLKNGAITGELEAFRVDLIVVFAYGRLLPPDVFELPPAGTINLHASILPLLRGASPIQSALLEGFTETGWSIQFIAAGMDTGDVLSEVRLSVDPDETAGELTERLVPAGVQLMLDTLETLGKAMQQGGDVRQLATPQNHERSTHCRKITSEMARIDWSRSALEIHNTIRALNPKPIARTTILTADGGALKIHRTRLLDMATLESLTDFQTGDAITPENLKAMAPGQLLAVRLAAAPALASGSDRADSGAPGSVAGGQKSAAPRPAVLVTTGAGCLEILELQPENRKKLTAKDFLNGYRKANPVLLGSTTT